MERLDVDKLVSMRSWIDENFPKFYGPYEKEFIKKAESLDLNPYTLKAVKREFELRFNVNKLEWQLLHILLHFSAMRQGGINNRYKDNKKVDVDIQGVDEKDRKFVERMALLMWDVIEN